MALRIFPLLLAILQFHPPFGGHAAASVGENHNFGAEVCSICLDQIGPAVVDQAGIPLVQVTECGHTFHRKCLSKWWDYGNYNPSESLLNNNPTLRTNDRSTRIKSCPFCRSPLSTQERKKRESAKFVGIGDILLSGAPSSSGATSGDHLFGGFNIRSPEIKTLIKEKFGMKFQEICERLDDLLFSDRSSLPTNTSYTSSMCYEAALKLDITNARAWARLGSCLCPGSSMNLGAENLIPPRRSTDNLITTSSEISELFAGADTAKGCYERALGLDPTMHFAWLNLAELGGGHVLTTQGTNGETEEVVKCYTEEECFVRALEDDERLLLYMTSQSGFFPFRVAG